MGVRTAQRGMTPREKMDAVPVMRHVQRVLAAARLAHIVLTTLVPTVNLVPLVILLSKKINLRVQNVQRGRSKCPTPLLNVRIVREDTIRRRKVKRNAFRVDRVSMVTCWGAAVKMTVRLVKKVATAKSRAGAPKIFVKNALLVRIAHRAVPQRLPRARNAIQDSTAKSQVVRARVTAMSVLLATLAAKQVRRSAFSVPLAGPMRMRASWCAVPALLACS